MVGGKYHLEELLGSGGMGHVYRALNIRAGRMVALKILRSEHATNQIIVERFLREALAANLVRHPNVVDVLDVDKDANDGSPYIVQELLQGEDLEKFVKLRGGRLNVEEIETLLLPIIDAVGEAHARGVVHRDIKPENVFLAMQAGRRVPKLLDFGISKVRLPDIKVTDVGVMMGTPAYMAPEQVHGGSREADPRSDVWALGIMLWELMIGHLPWQDANDAPALFVAIATKEVPKMIDVDPSIDPHISHVIERCLRRELDARYPTAAELARDLRHVLAGTDIEPTLRRSIPPIALIHQKGLKGFEIPDLIMPGSARVPDVPEPPANPTAAVGALELDIPQRNEPPRQITAPMSQPAKSVPTLPLATPKPIPALQQPAPPSSGGLGGQPRENAASRPMDGVMMSGSVSSNRRPPAAYAGGSMYQPPAEKAQPEQSMALIIALGVCGLVPVLTTAVLTTVAGSSEGWNLVAFLMKPSQPTSMLIQGGLCLVALGSAGATMYGAFKRWRGDIAGGPGAAILYAALAGGMLFAAMQLGRAAW